jgi:hypothetical protein
MSVGYDCKTLDQAQAGTGYQVLFSSGKRFVSVLARTGTFWVRRRSPLDGIGQGASFTSPVPGGVGTTVDGWIKITDGQEIDLGKDHPESTLHVPAMDQILGFDVWCVLGGDLLFNPSR